jgi:hypothetical protein
MGADCVGGMGALVADEIVNFHSLWKWFHFIELHGRSPSEEEEGDDSLLF